MTPAGVDLPLAPKPPARGPAPLAPAAPPAVRGLSYSALSLYRKCGYRFYLQRLLRLPQDEETGGRPPQREADGRLEARLRGSLAHDALEHATGDPADLVSQAAQRFGVELTEAEHEDITTMVQRFRASTLAQRVAQAGRVRREHVFSFPLGRTMLTGVVDVLAYEEDGTALLVDYKTDRLAEGTTAEELVRSDYEVQRLLYALAVLKDGAPGVEVAYAFIDRPGDPVTALYTPDDVPRLERTLEAMAEGIHAGRFEVAPEPHLGLCAGCPGRQALCTWPTELTGRERGA
jgi:RecB family exonuclease